MNTQQLELQWVRRIKNVLFCIDTDFVSYNDLLSGSYDNQLRIHMYTDSGEMLATLSPVAFQQIERYIEIENNFRKNMFSQFCIQNKPTKQWVVQPFNKNKNKNLSCQTS